MALTVDITIDEAGQYLREYYKARDARLDPDERQEEADIVASLSGHVEGSRTFSRYREIDKEIKTNVVKILD
ncbi:MAG: hypothetical protein MJY44_05795 [Bacteroidales bacterium]|nr:hypothetical protein [Bacteroidales bacterium]